MATWKVAGDLSFIDSWQLILKSFPFSAGHFGSNNLWVQSLVLVLTYGNNFKQLYTPK